jgi:hypothetical protein
MAECHRLGRLVAVSPLSVYEGSPGVPPAHRVGVVVIAWHGKGNRGVSVDSPIEAWVVGQLMDPLAESGPLCTGNSRQQWCIRSVQAESHLLCMAWQGQQWCFGPLR